MISTSNTVQVCLDTPNLGDKTVNRINNIDIGTIPKEGQVSECGISAPVHVPVHVICSDELLVRFELGVD